MRVDGRHHRGVVVAREDGGQDDRRRGRLLPASVDDRLEAPGDVGHLGLVAGLLADVVGAGEEHDDLRVDAVQLAVLQAPQDVLRPIPAPAEVAGIPAVEGLLPMGQEVRVVEGAPATGDGVAQEVEIDAAALRLGQELLVGEVGVAVGAHPRLVRGNRGRRVVDQPVRPGDEEAHVRAVLVSAVVLAPGELAVEQARVDGRHLRHAVVLGHPEVSRPEQAEDRARRHRGHVAALLVEPVGVALLRDAVADEGRARRAQGDELVRVDRDVAAFLLPKDASAAPYFRKLPAIQW